MAGLGRVLVGGRDRGAGFALGPRLVVTAHHVVRDRGDKPVVYVPAGGEAVGVERVQPDAGHDAAILWLAGDVEFLPAATAVRGAGWRVESPPGGNDPQLHGTVTTARMTIQNASGEPVKVMQLEVGEQLGDFGGYSGSAVLDSLGRTVLALLVEQKPLRTAVALGERRPASNVLYAVPIGDVITANGLPVRAARPLRFDVGLLPPGMVTRPGLLDEAVRRITAAEGGDAGAGLVLVRGPGGMGKTVLARQLADDVRVWAQFTDGIIMLRAGQNATADGVAGQLQEALGYRDRNFADALGGQRLLLIVDDVWNRELLRMLQAGLPPTVTVLATTRGVSVPGAVAVLVGAVGEEEAIEILARGTARSGELDQALAGLAETLFRWALLLTLAAAEIHRDDELDWEFDGKDNSQPGGTEAGVLVGRANTLRAEFPDDPTMLDDLERTPQGAPPRSLEVLVRRSLDWLGPGHQPCFDLLAIYPPGAAITQPMLEDLWKTSPNAARKEIKILVRAGLAQPLRSHELTIELHDLITAWLHHERGRPNDALHQQVHQRLAGLCLRADGSPSNLTKDRAEWLAYHLVAAGAWDRLKALPTLKWRSAFLVATGSDAAFLAGLDYYAHAALTQAPDAAYHAVRAWLFAAHVRTLIGRLPVSVLVATALVGDPIAAITQACQHPKAGEALPAVLAALADRPDAHLLLERAVALAGTIPDDRQRGQALAGISEQLAAADPSDPALIDQAIAVAGTIPDDRQRGQALAVLADLLAAAGSRDPALINQAIALAETIPRDWGRGEALASIAGRLAVIDPPRAAALIDQAIAVAGTIPDDVRRWTLAGIAERLAAANPSDPALINKAIGAAKAISNHYGRSQALARIPERLAAADPSNLALINKAIALAETIPHDDLRGGALAGIAGRLAVIDPARSAALIDQAIAAADTISDEPGRSWALEVIANWLAAAHPPDPALINQALAAAETIPSDQNRSRALASLAEQLAAANPSDPALINHALAVAETIPLGGERGGALAGIAGRLAVIDPARSAALIDQAIAAAETIPSPGLTSSMALAGLAERLAATDPSDPELIGQAIAVAKTIDGDGDRSRALAGLAERLASADPSDPALIDRAIAVAGTIPDGGERSAALAGIAGRLGVIDPARSAALFHQVIAAAETIPKDWERWQALDAIAEGLAAADRRDPALIDRTIAAAGTINDGELRSKALAGIAGRLAAADPMDPALIGQAIAAAETILNDQGRSSALEDIAGRLAAADPPNLALIAQAIAVAGIIPLGGERSAALAGIAGRLAVIDPARSAALIAQAIAAAETIPGGFDRGWAQRTIAERLTAADPQNPALVSRALAVAKTLSDHTLRDAAVTTIAERLAAADPPSPALIDQVLAVAETILHGDRDHSRAVAALAERLAAADPSDPALIDRAIAAAETIPYNDQRNQALARIHALTRSGMLEELSHWRLRYIGHSIDLLTVFLGNSQDKTTAESLGLAVLDVAVEVSAGT